jgi:hypothetical protein
VIVLNNVATTDGYSASTTREQPGTARVNLEVFNAAIYYQLKYDPGDWQDEVYAAPGRQSLDEHCAGIRIRSALAGTPAKVTAKLKTAKDVGLGA